MIFNIAVSIVAFTLVAMACYFLGLGYLIDRYTKDCNDKG
jgi:hypothetical protein